MEVLRQSKQHKPKMFPVDLTEAAKYWIAHQEKPYENNDRMTPIKKNEEVIAWQTLYRDRLVVRLRVFLAMSHINQLYVINTFESLPEGAVISTDVIAKRLSCPEYQAQAALSWLVAGGHVEIDSTTRRRDHKGCRNHAERYRFTGVDDLCRVPQNLDDRNMLQENRASQSITEFLARPRKG